MSYFQKEDGVQIFYQVKGDPNAKETIAFLNGVMMTWASWHYQIDFFVSMGYRVLVHDLRGQLLSSKPKGPYSFALHAADLKDLLDHLGFSTVHLVGTSYGGEVGMRFAIDYPERVASLSIIDSVSELDPVLIYFIKGWKTLAQKNSPEDFFEGMLPTVYGSDYLKQNPDFIQERINYFKKTPPDYFQGQVYLYDTFLSDVTMTEELYKIKAPSLIIFGEEDIIKPRKFSEILAQKIPCSEFVIIPHAGHAVFYEKPNTINTLLLGFITKNSSSPESGAK